MNEISNRWAENEVRKIPKDKQGICECCGKIIGGLKVRCVECSDGCTKDLCRIKEMR